MNLFAKKTGRPGVAPGESLLETESTRPLRVAAVKIRLDDPTVLPDLVEELASRVDAVIGSVGSDEIEIWLLGSRTAAATRAEVEARLRSRSAARDARVWVVLDEQEQNESPTDS
jgi:hypothetical protein